MINLITLIALLISAPANAQFRDRVEIDLSDGAKARGKAVFMRHCVSCHGLKYYRGAEAPSGISPLMDAQTAEAAFGVLPPDLSLMASTRGKGIEGGEYIYSLLTTYYTADGSIRNRAFAEETHTDGEIAMPPPIPLDDPELAQKAMDVSAFLFMVSDPALDERESTGAWVLGYMAVLTAVLYALNRQTWLELGKKEKA